MKFILLVTWFLQGQPPSSYQVEFSSYDDCDAARGALIAEQKRMQAHAAMVVQNAAKQGRFLSSGPPVPSLTAVCVTRKP